MDPHGALIRVACPTSLLCQLCRGQRRARGKKERPLFISTGVCSQPGRYLGWTRRVIKEGPKQIEWGIARTIIGPAIEGVRVSIERFCTSKSPSQDASGGAISLSSHEHVTVMSICPTMSPLGGVPVAEHHGGGHGAGSSVGGASGRCVASWIASCDCIFPCTLPNNQQQ